MISLNFLILFVSLIAGDISCSESERVITELDDVFEGVPVDFSYNESNSKTASTAGGLFSVPGCPKSVEGYPWVYFGSPVKCFLAGERGPCDSEQKLFIKNGSPYGFCNCECFEGIQRNKNASQIEFCTSKSDGREFVFISERNQCFSLFEQGPCKSKDEWLVKSTVKNRNVTLCESRKCPSGQIPSFDDDNDEGADKMVHSRNFSCFSHITPYFSPVSILPNDCDFDGMKYSQLLKKCVKKVSVFNVG